MKHGGPSLYHYYYLKTNELEPHMINILIITSCMQSTFCFVLLVGGNLGLDLLMVIPSVDAAISLEGDFSKRIVLTARFLFVFGPWLGFEPKTFTSGETPPTDVCGLSAGPKL